MGHDSRFAKPRQFKKDKLYFHIMKSFYERYWENTDALNDYTYKLKLIKKLVPEEDNLEVLDFGCGKGAFIKDILSINPTLKITGADISQTAITAARKKLPKQKFYILTEGGKLPFKDKSFDFILALDVFLHIYDTELIFKEITRVLKHGGRLLITVPYYGLLKNIVIALIGFDEVYNPRNGEIRFYTKNTLLNEIKAIGLTPIKFGYFSRFYPFSKAMYCVSKKNR